MTTCRETRSPTSILTSLSNSDRGLPLFLFLLLLLLLLHTSSPASAQDTTPPPPPAPPPLQPFARLRFNKSMGIIFVILVVVFFVIGFISVYSRQCTERRFRGGRDLANQIGGSSRGLDPEFIHAFPTFVYSSVKGLKIGRNTLECAVCLNEFQDNDTLRFIPKCNHVFHPDCIDLWLSSHSTCPVCRANLTPRPGDTSFVAVQIPDSALPPEPEEQDGGDDVIRLDHNNANRVGDSGSSPKDRDINIINLLNRNLSTNRSPAPRIRSTGFRFGSLFPRSDSTGHSLVSPGNDRERFTLRLPEEVRKELLSSTLKRTKSCGTLTSMRSERRGFRTRSVGGGGGGNYLQYEQSGCEGRLDRWGFSWTPPFVGRSGSSWSRKGSSTERRKAPVDGSEVAVDHLGERSFDRLCPEREDALN